MPCGGHLRYRQIFPRAYWFVHLHHLVFILQKHKEKLHVLDDSLTADAYPYPAGASFWNPATNQAAALSATKAAKAGWIITTDSVLSFHFLGMPLGGHLPVSLALSKPRRI